MFFNFCLGPPLPRGVPEEGPDCHFPKEIVGFGPIPARILGFLIFILALSTARQLTRPTLEKPTRYRPPDPGLTPPGASIKPEPQLTYGKGADTETPP